MAEETQTNEGANVGDVDKNGPNGVVISDGGDSKGSQDYLPPPPDSIPPPIPAPAPEENLPPPPPPLDQLPPPPVETLPLPPPIDTKPPPIDTKPQQTSKPLPPVPSQPHSPGHSPRAHTVGEVTFTDKPPAHHTLNKSQEMSPKLDRKGSLACIDPNGSAEDKKKSKWPGIFGWMNKLKGSKEENGNGKAPSGREKLPREKTNTNLNDHTTTPDTKPTEEQTDSESHARKVIIVNTIEDFPEECQKWIKQCGIPREKLEANFKILMNVLHFRSGKIFKTTEMLNDPPRAILPRSTRIKRGEELVTDAAEFKKLYKDMEELGKGGFGTVFHARSTRDKKKPVAIKRMEHKTKKQKAANFHEASILSFCNHPNIVRYMTCHEIKEELWVVMELMEGGTFEDAAKAWHFSESNIAYIARELLKGIAYMHANNLAHRDLKSANIMMSVRGEVKIIDLGLCADLSVGFPTHMVGSPFWMPPEMIQCKPHNSAVDIWSFAISLLEIANQRPPMIESAVKAMFTVGTEGVKDLFVDSSKWSEVFKDFLGLCLKIDAEERATAETLLNHPFIKLADTRANMENILRRIFLSNSLLNSGF